MTPPAAAAAAREICVAGSRLNEETFEMLLALRDSKNDDDTTPALLPGFVIDEDEE